jgi:hypothetical protein
MEVKFKTTRSQPTASERRGPMWAGEGYVPASGSVVLSRERHFSLSKRNCI